MFFVQLTLGLLQWDSERRIGAANALLHDYVKTQQYDGKGIDLPDPRFAKQKEIFQFHVSSILIKLFPTFFLFSFSFFLRVLGDEDSWIKKNITGEI